MSETLKPCPFCGSVAELRSEGKHHFVACTDEEECGVEGHRARVYDYAIETWNYRTAAEQVRAPSEGDVSLLREAKLTRPIIGIENRTPQEVFDIMCDRILSALTGASAVGEDDALKYATRLLVALMEKYYPDRHPDWKPLPDLYGVLTQIDNLTTGLVRASAVGEVEPLAWIGQGTKPIRDAEYRQLSKSDASLYDTPLYAAPVQSGDGLAGARDAFLDLIADAIEWKEEPDGDMDSDGRMIDCTTYHLITSYRQIDELVDALKIDRRYDETSGQAIARAIAAPTKGGE